MSVYRGYKRKHHQLPSIRGDCVSVTDGMDSCTFIRRGDNTRSIRRDCRYTHCVQYSRRYRICLLLLLLATSATVTVLTQSLPSPGVIFSFQLEDASAEGIVYDKDQKSVYITTNQAWDGRTYAESWVRRLDAQTGQVLQSQVLNKDRSKVGACVLVELGNESILVINPWTGDDNYNVGIIAVRTDTFKTLWTSNIARQSDKGIAPLLAPRKDKIIFYSTSSGIAVFDLQGRTIWATTTVAAGQIAVTNTSLYALDQTPSLGYPLNAYSIDTGRLLGTTGPLDGASSTAGVVLSPDGNFVYSVRSGFDGGLYRNRATFLFVPGDLMTGDVDDAYRWGPLLSPDGNTIYIINTLQVLIEAYSLTQDKVLWRSTLCPYIPPLLSEDGKALYSFTCTEELVRVDTTTSDLVWKYTLPKGFVANAMTLYYQQTKECLLVAGTELSTRKAYAWSFYTEDATLVPIQAPSQPTPSPTPAVTDPVLPTSNLTAAPSVVPNATYSLMDNSTATFGITPASAPGVEKEGTNNSKAYSFQLTVLGLLWSTAWFLHEMLF